MKMLDSKKGPVYRPVRARGKMIEEIQSAEKRTLENIGNVKTAFGLDNAKYMPIEDAVRYFIPPAEFKTLFVAKNHILMGSRGSGKTTWVRMLAHDHVMLAAKDGTPRTAYARDALARNLIGIYVPASSAFTGDLKNKPWQTEEEAENYFVWRMNVHSCAAFTHVLRTCIDQYVLDGGDRYRVQAELCRKLAASWTMSEDSATTFEGLRLILSEIELKHQTELRRRRTSSTATVPYTDYFDSDFLLPLRHCINALKALVNIPQNAVWMVCLDEVEYWTEMHHRILNTHMRSSSGDLVFKIATMPFAHHTLATNMSEPLREGSDFEYVHVDRESIDSRGGRVAGEFLTFARDLFERRITFRSPELHGLSLQALLGLSPLLDEKKMNTSEEVEALMALIHKHANSPTIQRAERLKGTPKFMNEIVRKIHGALLLRDASLQHHGNARFSMYCGEATIVRCCDGNARRFMRAINLLVQKIKIDVQGRPILPIDPTVQNEVLVSIARDTLSRTPSEPPNGALTGRYLKAIGKYMQWQFTNSSKRIGTDLVTSVTIEEGDGVAAQNFIKQAIQLSLMTPAKDVTVTTSDKPCIGTFHLAFLFAPLFHLLPRRNGSVRLSRALTLQSDEVQAQAGRQQTLLESI